MLSSRKFLSCWHTMKKKITKCTQLHTTNCNIAIVLPILMTSRILIYSMITQRGNCSLRYWNSSGVVDGQLVSSSSRRFFIWVRLHKPPIVNRGQPVCEHAKKNYWLWICINSVFFVEFYVSRVKARALGFHPFINSDALNVISHSWDLVWNLYQCV